MDYLAALAAILMVLVIIMMYSTSRERMATCQVSSEAINRCQESIKAYTAAIQAVQDQAQKDAAAVNQRNIEITKWKAAYDVELQKRDEGRLASSKQVWYQNKLYDCSKLPIGA